MTVNHGPINRLRRNKILRKENRMRKKNKEKIVGNERERERVAKFIKFHNQCNV